MLLVEIKEVLWSQERIRPQLSEGTELHNVDESFDDG